MIIVDSDLSGVALGGLAQPSQVAVSPRSAALAGPGRQDPGGPRTPRTAPIPFYNLVNIKKAMENQPFFDG